MSILKICALALALADLTSIPALTQQCPQSSTTGPTVPSEARTLYGTLIYHDSIRKWFELKLQEPQCGQSSIQLVRGDDWTPLEVLRGCQVRAKGTIDFSTTGYFSLDMYQDVDEIEAVGVCARQLPFPDYSKMKPDRSIREYRVDMHVNYEPGDHPVVFRISSSGRELVPWQAYASYWMTGGFVLYGRCGKGFVVDRVFGTPQANPRHFDWSRSSSDMASFDPENATASGKKALHLGYTCMRKR